VEDFEDFSYEREGKKQKAHRAIEEIPCELFSSLSNRFFCLKIT